MKPLLYFCFLLFIACEGQKMEFADWKMQHAEKVRETYQTDTATFFSPSLAIDTIYRSMQGPYQTQKLQLSEGNEVVYIVGYRNQVLEAESDTVLPSRFMCHNNLNYAEKEKLPWKLKTSGANSRIFTLSEGQTDLRFPAGFGIPIPANTKLEMVSQVLNHHQKEIDIRAKHQVEMIYAVEGEKKTINPLYQQSVFITKQVGGPEGVYGLPLSCVDHIHEENVSKKENIHDCSIEYEEGQHNPYRDKYGREYTGHWELPLGEESLRTDVTKMLDLEEDTKIHFIGVHLHPFAEKLSLWDTTEDKLLYESTVEKDSANFSFNKIHYYSDQKGIAVYKDHHYELRSTYHCTDSSAVHTAMAVMYLYLADV